MALSDKENKEVREFLKKMNFSFPLFLKMNTLMDDEDNQHRYYIAEDENKLFDLAHIYCLETQLSTCSKQEYLANKTR